MTSDTGKEVVSLLTYKEVERFGLTLACDDPYTYCKRLRETCLALFDVARLADGFCKAAMEWNASVEAIIGRQPQTGIPITALRDALAKVLDGN